MGKIAPKLRITLGLNIVVIGFVIVGIIANLRLVTEHGQNILSD
jgi:hypothetical protein